MMTILNQLKLRKAKKYWRNHWCGCEHGEIIFNAIHEHQLSSVKHVLEFGCSWGGNLQFLLDRLPSARAVGIDLNEWVMDMAEEYPNYTGIVGDETELARFSRDEFDLAFTISVLDHIPVSDIVEEVINRLVRISKTTLLLEPFIEGTHGDYSGMDRDSVVNASSEKVIEDFVPPQGLKQALTQSEKLVKIIYHFVRTGNILKDYGYIHGEGRRFSENSCLWNYDDILNGIGVDWRKVAMPLHEASLGPYYFLYIINSSDNTEN